MALSQDHINQANRNLAFLQSINSHSPQYFDWQVTVCFYAALHLVNAHLAEKNMQYRSHRDVKEALNPRKPLSPTKLPDDEYTAYISLQMLSRRSRYLVNEKDGNLATEAPFLTYGKHLSKAIRHLDTLIGYFSKSNGFNISPVTLRCPDLKNPASLQTISITA